MFQYANPRWVLFPKHSSHAFPKNASLDAQGNVLLQHPELDASLTLLLAITLARPVVVSMEDCSLTVLSSFWNECFVSLFGEIAQAIRSSLHMSECDAHNFYFDVRNFNFDARGSISMLAISTFACSQLRRPIWMLVSFGTNVILHVDARQDSGGCW
jgi:hypothetical protein